MWRPEPADKPAWSAAGGVMTIVGATGTPVLALAPASAHVPTWLVYVSGALGVVGFYVMVAPLARWWPWSSSSRPYPVGIALIVIVLVIVIVIGRGGGAHVASGHSSSPKPTPAHKRTKLKNAVTYSGKYFTVQIPAGWSIKEHEVDRAGEKESTWTRSAEPNDRLLIDFSPATDLSLEQDAATVHEEVLHEEGSRELYYGVGDLSDIKSWMWIFRRPGSERIDYFFNRCSTGFAVLGSSVASRFDKLRPVFREVAESVRASCN